MGSRLSPLTAPAVCALVALLALLPSTGGAQVPLPPVATPPPAPPAPNPTASPSPSPTASASGRPAPQSTTAPRPAPASASPTASAAPADVGPTPFEGSAGDGIAYWLSLPKTPARTTARLLSLLERLLPLGQALTPQAVVRGVGRFPVAGYVWYADDWAAPRYVPYFHLHEGTDLFAEAGTPVIAPWGGAIAKLADGSVGGISIWLDGDDGMTYYYGHLQGYAPGLAEGARVRGGDVIGYVGDSGNAQGTPPHVHFEVHPFGGAPVPPKPILDRWLTLAEQRAEQRIVRRWESDLLARSGAARWHLLVEMLAEPGPVQPALWPSALDPAGATIGFADLALARLSVWTDWTGAADLQSTLVAEGPAPWAPFDPLARLQAGGRRLRLVSRAPFLGGAAR